MFSFKQATDLALARIFSITGRSSRSEYWWAYLGYLLTLFVLYFVSFGMLAVSEELGIVLICIASLVILAMSLCIWILCIRRLHDLDMSGLWILLIFVPFGGLILLVLTLLPSKAGVNRFGICPIEDPQGHYNYYITKQFKTGIAYGATFFNQPGFNNMNYNNMQGGGQPGFNNMNYGNMQGGGQPGFNNMNYGNMQGQPGFNNMNYGNMQGQQPMQSQPMYGQPMQQQMPQMQPPLQVQSVPTAQQPNQNQQQ